MLRGLVLSFAVAVIAWPLSAVADEGRFALLIGNKAYDSSVGVLKNPYNDIAVVGDALARQGFELLPPVKDAKRSAMLGAVRELVRRLNAAGPSSIGFLYYSGHGAAEKDTNVNYLIPVDATAPGTVEFWDESLRLDDVLQLLDSARSAAKFVVFDACRNELQLPTKDTNKGLVPVSDQEGMFIAYASKQGHTASDVGDRAGPYATALAAELGKPGLDHLNLFQNVKEAVLAATNYAQQPWESNGLARRIYLTRQQQQPSAPQPALNSTAVSEAAQAWSMIQSSEDVAILDAFRKQYGGANPFYDRLAASRIEMVSKGQAVGAKTADMEPHADQRRATQQAAKPSQEGAQSTASGDFTIFEGKGMYIAGNSDSRPYTTDYESCRSACRDTSNCDVFTFNRPSNLCYLYARRQISFLKDYLGFVSGIRSNKLSEVPRK